MTAAASTGADKAFRGVVYGFDLLDHESVMNDTPRVVPDDYVGKTRQRGRGRENQHRDDKPWEDLIVGSNHILWEGICVEDYLDERERAFIRDRRPRMNDKDNRWNPERIPYGTQVRQRHARDDKFGRPRWQPIEKRQRQSLLEWNTPDGPAPLRSRTPARRPRKGEWRPWQRQLLGWSMAWFLLTVGAWILEFEVAWDTDFWRVPCAAGAGVVFVRIWLAWRFWPALPLWRRLRRKLGIR